ncbi:hypothetical protein E4U59_005900 [Claviceps monticola]|nr:hypothetical protein E4U59_005900 [Claviceps monticola]
MPFSIRPATAARRLMLTRRTLGLGRLTRSYSDSPSQKSEMAVGELQGVDFRVAPLRRNGENDDTKRARLLYQSRKRGILESDLLMSTFAKAHLPTMSSDLLTQYDLLLDENDWDLYYWATQHEPTDTSFATNPADDAAAQAVQQKANDDEYVRAVPPSGEWAQTVGNFKAAYRPVPARWKGSEILELLRAHVKSRSVEGEGGMAFMPALGGEVR